jgi:hypothetical protein
MTGRRAEALSIHVDDEPKVIEEPLVSGLAVIA